MIKNIKIIGEYGDPKCDKVIESLAALTISDER